MTCWRCGGAAEINDGDDHMGPPVCCACYSEIEPSFEECPLNGLNCSVCGQPQRMTWGGDSCGEHGGADGVDGEPPPPVVDFPTFGGDGWELINGDCLAVLKTFADESVDACVTDPPAGISFMGKAWDNPTSYGYTDGGNRVGGPPGFNLNRNPTCQNCGGRKRAGPATKGCACAEPAWNTLDLRQRDRDAFIALIQAVMVEVLRVLKPGGHALVWAIPRTSHWTATAVEDAGFEVRDVITHHYGCLSEDTEILVDGRWEPFRSATPGRRALCYDLTCDTLAWAPIEQLHVYDYDENAYHIIGATTDQIVSRNHRVLLAAPHGCSFCAAEHLHTPINVPVISEAKVEAALQNLPATVHAEESSGVSQGTVLLAGVLRRVAREESEDPGAHAPDRSERTSGLDDGEPRVVPAQNVWCEEPCLEGGRDGVQAARVVRGGAVRALPADVSIDGAPGWVRDGTPTDRGAGARALPSAERSGASRGSRPDEQCDIEPGAVCKQPRAQAVRGAWYASADLARVEPFHYTGKVWCVQVPTGAFVARRNGKAFITGNSGFPKSLDVSKAIDKAAGAERTIVGQRPDAAKLNKSVQESPGGWKTGPRDPNVTLPASVESARWEGFGTSLKPASEHWILARKPLGGTVAANVLAHGTGAINIDGCRIGMSQADADFIRKTARPNSAGHEHIGTVMNRPATLTVNVHDGGRWPANLVLSHHPDCRVVGTASVKGDVRAQTCVYLKRGEPCQGHDNARFGKTYHTSPGTRPGGFVDTGAESGDERPNGTLHGDAEVEVYECVEGCPVAELDRQSGVTKDGVAGTAGRHGFGTAYVGGTHVTGTQLAPMTYGDKGGASRFFYVAKAPKVERFSYLTCDCEGSNVPVWANEVRARSEAMGVTSRQKATSEETSEDVSVCSTSSCGNKSTAPCPQDTASITSTRTSKTTASRTCISSPIVPTNVSMEDANCATECGSSRVESVASSSPSTPTTSTCLPKDGPFTGVVAPATVASSVKKTTCVACGSEVRETAHPTVKPLSLMRWLVRLVGGQPGSVILDPFAGSGSTLVAALLEGFTVVGIDQEPEYIEIARRRIEWWQKHPEGK